MVKLAKKAKRFEPLTANQLSATAIVLSVFRLSENTPLTVAQLRAAGQLMGLDEGAVRMALSRLQAKNDIEQVERGVYQLDFERDVSQLAPVYWANSLQSMKMWKGGWLVVLTGESSRTDRKALRARAKALELYGFAEAKCGNWVRPDNLKVPLAALEQRLADLGLGQNASLLRVGEVLESDEARWRKLWPTDDLAAGYREANQFMARAGRRLSGLDLEPAAREALLVGQSVIAIINRDPRLPSDFGDYEGFETLVSLMTRYDTQGRRIWTRFFKKVGATT